MKKYLIILFLFPVSLLAQVNLSYIGQTFIDTTCTNVNGISIPRTDLATFVFKNNYVEACNTGGYMLQAGVESNTYPQYVNTLPNSEIIGNKFVWTGDQNANTITHGIFTGYEANARIMYNYLDYVPMGIIRKSNGMTDSTGVVAYNIIRNPPAGGVKAFTTKQAGDQIASAHINDLQAEVVAVETELRKTTGSVVDHGGLAGLADNDHPQYLLATGKAADSDKLDGKDSTDFSLATHNHDAAYLGITATAANSSKLGNVAAASYLQTPSAVTSTPTPTASSGAFTTVSAACRTTTFGKIRVYSGLVYITDRGTASGTLRVPIPSGTPQSLGGGKWAGSGLYNSSKACAVFLNPSNSYLEILLYDATTVIENNASISFTIVYEIK